MPGSSNLFDSVQLTSSSEYSSRNGERIDTLQIHHATMTSLSGLIGMMQPGGRTVSANGAMGNGGHLVEVVPLSQRAFTSASGYDRRSLTVEVCNTTLGPQWGISEECRVRLATLAVDMFRAGILGALNRDYIIGHFEVPGTYATACPGPDMNLDHIVWLANEIFKGTSPAGVIATPIIIEESEEDEMAIKFGHRKGENTDEWMIVHPDLRGTDDLQRGYLVTTDRKEATAWGRTYADGAKDYAFDVIRSEYIDIQNAARRAYDAKSRAELERRP